MCGLGDLMTIVEREKAGGVAVFVLFCGSQLESGQSWCPDCVKGGFHQLLFHSLRVHAGTVCLVWPHTVAMF